MSMRWLVMSGSLGLCATLAAWGIGSETVGGIQQGDSNDGNTVTGSNTTGGSSSTAGGPPVMPIQTPTPTPTPTPTCPSPANGSDYYGPARCCHTAAKLCEDFEGATLGGSPNGTLWVVAKGNADTVEISSAQAARGTQSLHIHASNSGNGQHAMIVNTSAFPFVNNKFWGRAFVYFNSASPSNHTTYMAAGPDPNPNYQWLRYSSFGGGQLGGNDSDPDNSAGSGQSLPHAAWACIEWQYDVPNLKAYYYFNGQLIATLNIDSKHNNTNDLHFQQIEIGWELYSRDNAGGAAWDMYFDEIALDTKRIGCAN